MQVEKIRLGDVVSFSKGQQINGDELMKNGRYDYLNGGINPSGCWNDFNVTGDTVTISEGGNSCGYVNYMSYPFWCGAHCYYLYDSKLNNKYLYYALKSQQEKIMKLRTGACMPNIKKTDLGKFELNITTDINAQELTVFILDKITALIDKRKKQLEKLDELVKSRFIEMFGDPNSNEKGWTVSTLGEYMTLLTDFSANGSYELLDSNVVMYDEPNYAVMVRTTDLEAGNLTDGVKYIDRTAYELLSKSKLYGGELIMNKIGSAGKIYIMPQIDKPASLGRNAFMFRFDDRINMVYLYALLSSDYGTKEIQQYVRGAVTKTITKESTRSIRVIVPPIELQEQYATFVKQVDKSKFEIKQSLKMLELLKKALMQKYFGYGG